MADCTLEAACVSSSAGRWNTRENKTLAIITESQQLIFRVSLPLPLLVFSTWVCVHVSQLQFEKNEFVYPKSFKLLNCLRSWYSFMKMMMTIFVLNQIIILYVLTKRDTRVSILPPKWIIWAQDLYSNEHKIYAVHGRVDGRLWYWIYDCPTQNLSRLSSLKCRNRPIF